MASRGLTSNDLRWGATLQASGTTIAGAAASAAVVTAAAITAPAWVTAAATVALGALFTVGIDLAIDGTVRWLMHSDGTVTVGMWMNQKNAGKKPNEKDRCWVGFLPSFVISCGNFLNEF